MDTTKILTWIKENPMTAAAISIAFLGAITLAISSTVNKNQIQTVNRPQLAGCGKSRYRRRTRKKVKLVGLK